MRQEVLIITCDVCGDRIEGTEIPYAYIGTQQLDPAEPDIDDGQTFDLCPHCRARLFSFIYAEQVTHGLRESAAGGVFEVVGPEIEPETKEPEEPKQTRSKIDKGKVYALWDAKWPADKIADEMGCSGATIYKILKERDK